MTFERVYVVNLDRRDDRWQAFLAGMPEDWPFPDPERVSAVDGNLCKQPQWWKQGSGAWGCYRTHMNIVERCLNEQVGSVLIFEDDAVFAPDFGEKVKAFLAAVPKDWEWIYLGGQHLKPQAHPPTRINDLVYLPYNVNRTHAYAVNGKMLQPLYRWLNSVRIWQNKHHLDHHYGRLHAQQKHRVYCPGEWLVGQAAGQSNIAGRVTEEKFWPSATVEAREVQATVVPVLGIYHSGAGWIAKVLEFLGVYLGDKVNESGIADGLETVCNRFAPFPEAGLKRQATLWKNLNGWFNQRRLIATRRNQLFGLFHPLLCRLALNWAELGAEGVRAITTQCAIDQASALLGRRSRTCGKKCGQLQTWLNEGRVKWVNQHPHLVIQRQALLTSPIDQVEKIIDFLELDVELGYIEQAIAFLEGQR